MSNLGPRLLLLVHVQAADPEPIFPVSLLPCVYVERSGLAKSDFPLTVLKCEASGLALLAIDPPDPEPLKKLSQSKGAVVGEESVVFPSLISNLPSIVVAANAARLLNRTTLMATNSTSSAGHFFLVALNLV